MATIPYDEEGLATNDAFGITFNCSMIENASGLLKTKPANGRGLREYSNKYEPTLHKTGVQLIERG